MWVCLHSFRYIFEDSPIVYAEYSWGFPAWHTRSFRAWSVSVPVILFFYLCFSWYVCSSSANVLVVPQAHRAILCFLLLPPKIATSVWNAFYDPFKLRAFICPSKLTQLNKSTQSSSLSLMGEVPNFEFQWLLWDDTVSSQECSPVISFCPTRILTWTWKGFSGPLILYHVQRHLSSTGSAPQTVPSLAFGMGAAKFTEQDF